MKKITVIILTVAAVFAFAACQQKENQTPVESAPTTTMSSEPTSTAPAATPEHK